MKDSKNYMLAILAFIFVMSSLTSLPFGRPELKKEASSELQHAEKQTFNESEFTIDEIGTIWLGSRVVVTGMGVHEQEELFYTKEEIVLRVVDNGLYLVAGDNGEF